jgi:hypothetical protein
MHLARAVAAAALMALLVVGCIALWTLIPLGWMWLGAQTGDGGLAYLIALAGAPPTMLAFGIALQRVEVAYWLVRGERPARSVMETLLIVSAIVAIVLFAALLFADPHVTPPLSH